MMARRLVIKMTHERQEASFAVDHSGHIYVLLLAESHLTRRLFGGMLRKIAALPSPAG